MKRGLLLTTTSQNASLGLLILRIGIGALILTHGYPKLMMIINGNWQFMDPLGIGSELSLVLMTFAEFFCAILIIVGLYTRLATIPLIIGMATAGFIFHADDAFGVKEKPFIFLVVFLALLFTGSGRYSVDRKL